MQDDVEKQISDILFELRGMFLGKKSWQCNPVTTVDPQIVAIDKVLLQLRKKVNRIVNEARIDELNKLPQSYDYIDSGGEYIYNYTTKAIKERLAELSTTTKERS